MNELKQILMEELNMSEEMAERYSRIEAASNLVIMLLQAEPSLSPFEIEDILIQNNLTKKETIDLIYLSNLYNIKIRSFVNKTNIPSILSFLKKLNDKTKILSQYIFSTNINRLDEIKTLIELGMPQKFLKILLDENTNIYSVIDFLMHVYSSKNISQEKILQVLHLMINNDFFNYIDFYNYLIRIPDLNVKFLYNNISVFDKISKYQVDNYFERQKDLELFLKIYQSINLTMHDKLKLFSTYKRYNIIFNENKLLNILENLKESSNKIFILQCIISGKATLDDVIKINKEYSPLDAYGFFELLSNNLDFINFDKMYKRLKYYENQGVGMNFLGIHPALFGSNIDLIKKFIEYKHESPDNEYYYQYHYAIFSVFRDRSEEWINKFNGNIHDAGQIVDSITAKMNISDAFFKLREFLFKYINNKNNFYLEAIVSKWPKLPKELKNNGDFDEILNYLSQEYNQYGGDNLNKLAFLFDIQPEKYYKVRKIYEDSLDVPLPQWAQIDPIKQGKYIGYFLQREDARGLFIGNFTDCCQHIDGQGTLPAIHSQASPYGAVFIVEDNKNNILAQSWAWEAEGQVIFDNIEGNIVKSDNDKRKFIILNIYKKAADKMKEKTGLDIFVGYNNEYGMKEEDLSIFYEGEKKVEEPLDYIDIQEKYQMGYLYDPDSKFIRRLASLSNKMDKKASDLSDKLEKMIKTSGYQQSLIKTYFKNLLSDVARFGKDEALSPFKKYVNQQIDPELFSMALSRVKTVPEARNVLRGFYSNVDDLSDSHILKIWDDAKTQHFSKHAPNYNVPIATGIGVGATPYLTTAPSTLSNTLAVGAPVALTTPLLFKKPKQNIQNVNQNNLSYYLANAKTQQEAKNILLKLYPGINDDAVKKIWIQSKQIA